MKLYDWNIAPNPRRVRIFLAEKGVEIPIEEVGDGARLRTDYVERYALGMVPMLELDDGTQISEAMAICRYFEAEYPEPALFGRSPTEKGLVEMWERFAYDFGVVGVAEILRNSNPVFADRGVPVYGDTVPQIPELAKRGKWKLGRFFRLIEKQIGDNSFIVGNHFSVADITAMCAINFARAVKETIPEDAPNVMRWYESVKARPSASA